MRAQKFKLLDTVALVEDIPKRKLRAEDVNLDKLIEEVARLLSHTVDPRIEIVCRFGLMGAAVTGDPSRL